VLPDLSCLHLLNCLPAPSFHQYQSDVILVDLKKGFHAVSNQFVFQSIREVFIYSFSSFQFLHPFTAQASSKAKLPKVKPWKRFARVIFSMILSYSFWFQYLPSARAFLPILFHSLTLALGPRGVARGDREILEENQPTRIS
jgi:hypothetical protein